VAKVRVYELAKEFGVESKAVMDRLKEMGEFVRSASSTIEAPVVRRLKESFAAAAAQNNNTATQNAGAQRQGQGASVPAGFILIFFKSRLEMFKGLCFTTLPFISFFIIYPVYLRRSLKIKGKTI
jgi:hypothetical protein